MLRTMQTLLCPGNILLCSWHQTRKGISGLAKNQSWCSISSPINTFFSSVGMNAAGLPNCQGYHWLLVAYCQRYASKVFSTYHEGILQRWGLCTVWTREITGLANSYVDPLIYLSTPMGPAMRWNPIQSYLRAWHHWKSVFTPSPLCVRSVGCW